MDWVPVSPMLLAVSRRVDMKAIVGSIVIPSRLDYCHWRLCVPIQCLVDL
jgi:hypothetical protein